MADQPTRIGRRGFLRGSLAAGAAAGLAATGPSGSEAANIKTGVNYPSRRLANIEELRENEPLTVHYPDADSPGLLVKLGRPVEGGVGAQQDIVAYSTLCPHKGMSLVYNSGDRSLNCPLHYSRFDAEQGGQCIFGSANQNLPQFTLRVDDRGDIYAEGVDELIYGRTSNLMG